MHTIRDSYTGVCVMYIQCSFLSQHTIIRMYLFMYFLHQMICLKGAVKVFSSMSQKLFC